MSEGFAEDFSVRARVTNNGRTKTAVSYTVTLFKGGSVVGSATGFASELESGSTITVDFITTDDFVEWETLEFQVDSEF